MNTFIKSIGPWVMLLFSSCNTSQSKEIVSLFFNERIIKVGDVIYEVTGPKLTNEQLVNIWLKTQAYNLQNPKHPFRDFARKKGLQIKWVKVDLDLESRHIKISGEINQKYPHHFRDTYTSFLNSRQIAALKIVTNQLQNLTEEEREMFSKTYNEKISRMAIDWNELILEKID